MDGGIRIHPAFVCLYLCDWLKHFYLFFIFFEVWLQQLSDLTPKNWQLCFVCESTVDQSAAGIKPLHCPHSKPFTVFLSLKWGEVNCRWDASPLDLFLFAPPVFSVSARLSEQVITLCWLLTFSPLIRFSCSGTVCSMQSAAQPPPRWPYPVTRTGTPQMLHNPSAPRSSAAVVASTDEKK